MKKRRRNLYWRWCSKHRKAFLQECDRCSPQRPQTLVDKINYDFAAVLRMLSDK